ncbi:conserved membrane protein of unknown function [Rhodovastum atsumiense]|uniref:Uncharacterized protein n=1 Tax=Rhodovastum atsumiense TaxID=504468 RepID=A0A5M6J175_9PROT|nr:hypothetical protein [Rhodovastum atsumiense]KAA5614343.1 hypothetical protein F1189_01770 [Rhodovastum atsumiense]CAH2604812.1 conserved membrane protein of unknown function [Rhodovastum atsumiense]
MTPWGEIGLLGISMGALTVLLRTTPGTLAQRLLRIAPVVIGLFLAGLALGRLAGVPGFTPSQGLPEYIMAGIGLLCWAGGLVRMLARN